MAMLATVGRGNETPEILNISIEYDRKNIKFYDVVDGLIVPYLRDGCGIADPQRDDNYISVHTRKKNNYVLFVPKENRLVTLAEFAESRGITLDHISEKGYRLKAIPEEVVHRERVKIIRMDARA